MSDTFATSFKMGGSLPKPEVPTLMKIIERDEWCLNWENKITSDMPIESLLNERQGIIELTDCAMKYEAWDDLAAFCQKHGLSYEVRQDAAAGYDGEIYWWQPGYDKVSATITNADGNPVIHEDTLKKVIDTYDIDQKLMRKELFLAMIHQLKGLLPSVPEIPPFQVAIPN